MERAVFEILRDFSSKPRRVEYIVEPGAKSRKIASHPSPHEKSAISRDELTRKFAQDGTKPSK